jgi:hypothetical protein
MPLAPSSLFKADSETSASANRVPCMHTWVAPLHASSMCQLQVHCCCLRVSLRHGVCWKGACCLQWSQQRRKGMAAVKMWSDTVCIWPPPHFESWVPPAMRPHSSLLAVLLLMMPAGFRAGRAAGHCRLGQNGRQSAAPCRCADQGESLQSHLLYRATAAAVGS